jgi:hypothetical protein
MDNKINIQPLVVTGKEAARMCGICETGRINLERRGLFGPRPMRLSGKLLYRVDELRDWVRAGMPPRHEWTYAPAAQVQPGIYSRLPDGQDANPELIPA